jgi:DNA-directed RNA polymerase subunit RPC12/RpoP
MVEMGKNQCRVCGLEWTSIKEEPLRCPRCSSPEWKTGKAQRRTYEHECAVCGAKWDSLKEDPIVCLRCHRPDWREGSTEKDLRERKVDEIKKILALRKGEESRIITWDLIDLIMGALACSKSTAREFVTILKERGLLRSAIVDGGPGWLITLDGEKGLGKVAIS